MPSLKETIQKNNDPVGFALRQVEQVKQDTLREVALMLERHERVLEQKIEAIEKADPKYGEIVQKATNKAVNSLIEIAKGEKGEPGKDGESIVGPMGPQGLKGDSIVGPQGPMGPKGQDGKDGQSIVGPKGEDGKDGSPDTAQQIADKLNTTEQTVEKKVIIGLEDELKGIKKVIREKGGGSGGGGGMGNIQHESKAVSSATTTVSTTYPIAGGGFAIWGFYQGQMIVRGTHYTVGTDRKTLTLTFTPQDSTSIDLIYIR